MKRREFACLGFGVVACAAGLALAMPSGAQPAPREIVVVMDNMNFGTLPKDAKVGDVIVWDNPTLCSTPQRRATAASTFGFSPGGKGRTVLRRAGNLAVYCIYHPMMRATLKVAS
jgi:plastocyanin